MGGFSVQCDCCKWFIRQDAHKDHCKSKGCVYHPDRVGGKPIIDEMSTITKAQFDYLLDRCKNEQTKKI